MPGTGQPGTKPASERASRGCGALSRGSSPGLSPCSSQQPRLGTRLESSGSRASTACGSSGTTPALNAKLAQTRSTSPRSRRTDRTPVGRSSIGLEMGSLRPGEPLVVPRYDGKVAGSLARLPSEAGTLASWRLTFTLIPRSPPSLLARELGRRRQESFAARARARGSSRRSRLKPCAPSGNGYAAGGTAKPWRAS